MEPEKTARQRETSEHRVAPPQIQASGQHAQERAHGSGLLWQLRARQGPWHGHVEIITEIPGCPHQGKSGSTFRGSTGAGSDPGGVEGMEPPAGSSTRMFPVLAGPARGTEVLLPQTPSCHVHCRATCPADFILLCCHRVSEPKVQSLLFCRGESRSSQALRNLTP